MAHTKGFDPTSGSSTLHFDEDENDDDDDMPHIPNLHHDISSSSTPLSIGGFTFTEDHYNLVNGHIDSLASSIDGLSRYTPSSTRSTGCYASSTQ